MIYLINMVSIKFEAEALGSIYKSTWRRSGRSGGIEIVFTELELDAWRRSSRMERPSTQGCGKAWTGCMETVQ